MVSRKVSTSPQVLSTVTSSSLRHHSKPLKLPTRYAVPVGRRALPAPQLGRIELAHRIAMAPMGRMRADKNHVPGDLMVEFYAQRASVPGTLLITEATVISPQAGGYEHVPGIYTEKQIAGWKRVTDAVHAKGSYVFAQLWAVGRAADADVLAREGGFPLVAPSSVPLEGKVTPHALSVPEIQQYVRDFAQAARSAVAAGFDGVEIHGANGYLHDQFLQDVTNARTDAYGGSVEGRSRFSLEVVRAVVDAVGQDRTSIRLSPWSEFHEMGMADPVPQFLHVIRALRAEFPGLAYLHLIEPILDPDMQLSDSNDVFREAWAPKPLLSASGYTHTSALKRSSERDGEIIVFGRHFLANPDLPRRLKEDIPLNHYDRETFYVPESAIGYVDYPFAEEQRGVVQAHL